MKLFVCSDLHLYHKNILMYCGRPFNSEYDMSNALIQNWNAAIDESSTVYHLGDLFMGNPALWHTALAQLNYGVLRCILGNHDRINKLQDAFDKAGKSVEFYSDYFLEYGEHTYWLQHYPIDRPQRGNPKFPYTRCLCGHCHDKQLFWKGQYGFPNCLNVGVDVSEQICGRPYSPISMDEVEAWFDNNEDK